MALRDYYERKGILLVADAIGIAHFLVANVLIGLGEVTNLFSEFGARLSGMRFVLNTIDRPVFSFFHWAGVDKTSDIVYPLIVGEVVIIISSIIYALVAYIFLKLVEWLFW